MAITISYPGGDIFEVFQRLGILKPASAAFLPRNLQDSAMPNEFVYESETKTLRKLLRVAGVPESPLEHASIPSGFIHEKSEDWIGPTLFVAHSLLQNEAMLAVYLNVLSNYFYDLFRNRLQSRRARFEIVIETTPEKEVARVNYDGHVAGISELQKTIRELKK